MIRADLLYFTKGGEAQLPARVEGNRVVLSMPDGEIELAREDCHKIVPGFWPAAGMVRPAGESGAGGFNARFAAMWWAVENGLTTEAAEEVRASTAWTRSTPPPREWLPFSTGSRRHARTPISARFTRRSESR